MLSLNLGYCSHGQNRKGGGDSLADTLSSKAVLGRFPWTSFMQDFNMEISQRILGSTKSPQGFRRFCSLSSGEYGYFTCSCALAHMSQSQVWKAHLFQCRALIRCNGIARVEEQVFSGASLLLLSADLEPLLSAFQLQEVKFFICVAKEALWLRNIVLIWWCINSGFCCLSPIYWSLLETLLAIMFLIITISPAPLNYPRYWYFSAFLSLVSHSSSPFVKVLTITLLSHARNYQYSTYSSKRVLVVKQPMNNSSPNPILRDCFFLLTSSVNSLNL